MLANGAKLSYSATKDGEYVELTGLKEIPDMGIEPEKVENTCLADKVKQYELGIGDAGDLTYKFKYVNDSEDAPYRVMMAKQASKETVYFKEVLSDGTTTSFCGQVAVKRTGAGVNDPIEFELSIGLQSDLEVTNA